MLSRRLIAFRENAQRLIDREGKLYLWTFTLPRKMSPKDGAKMWALLLDRMRRWVPGWAGVRVFERHPGGNGGISEFIPEGAFWKDSHGLHVHFVCTRFYYVQEIRRVCQEAGWGRIHVARIKGGKDGRKRVLDYLAKYLSKKRHPDLAGIRLVGYVGIKDVVRQRDIVCSGHLSDLWAAAKELQGWHSLNFFGKMEAVRWLDYRCLAEGGSPIEQIEDFRTGAARAADRERRKRGEIWTQGPEQAGILLLMDLGIMAADDNNRARRFLSKVRQMPKQQVCLN